MQINKQLLFMVFATLLAGCAQTMEKKAMPADAEQSAQAIEAAIAAAKKADSVDGEWRDTGKIIKDAQAAADKGDYTNAVKLAKKAQQQGELGYQQAVSQKELKLPSYLQ